MSDSETNLLIEPERYEFAARPIHRFDLQRRDFFKLLGAGIAVFSVAKCAAGAQETGGARGFRGEETPKDITSWLHIGEDGKVTVFTGKVEIGQNIRTSLAQSVADELRVPFDSVTLVMGDTALTPYDMGTFGSRSTPYMTPQLRRAASAARDVLVAEAAKKWNVAANGLVARDGKVSEPASGRSLSYGELAAGKALARDMPDADPTTPAAQWTVAGKPQPKVDGRAFVTGKHQYTVDLRPAGMLHGKVLRAPSFLATLVSIDTKAAEAMPGVTVVRDGNFVGVAAPSEGVAAKAIAAMRAEWKETKQPSGPELFSYLKSNVENGDGNRDKRETGSIDDGLSRAAHRLAQTYTVAYIAHAPLEPRFQRRVARVLAAFECGAIVNPDGLRNQVIGANIMGLGGALFEAVEFDNGRITNPHFAGYRVPRFRDVPEIEAVLLDRKDIPSAGAGETPIVGVAPAIGNAIFDATGVRLRSLPLVPKGLKA